jgi:hypothetical protein
MRGRGGPFSSESAEPVVAVSLPVAPGVVVADLDLADVLGVLKTELGRDAQLHRKSVLARQHAVVEPESANNNPLKRNVKVDQEPQTRPGGSSRSVSRPREGYEHG